MTMVWRSDNHLMNADTKTKSSRNSLLLLFSTDRHTRNIVGPVLKVQENTFFEKRPSKFRGISSAYQLFVLNMQIESFKYHQTQCKYVLRRNSQLDQNIVYTWENWIGSYMHTENTHWLMSKKIYLLARF